VTAPTTIDGAMMNEHEIALTVNRLRDIAKEYGQTQQLRQRIAAVVVPLLSASKPAAPEVDSANFVQRVPDHCDRIVWRGAYYGLPPAAPAQPGEPVAWMLEVPSDSTRWYTSGKQAKDHWVSKGAVATPLYAAPQSSQPVEVGEGETS